MMSRPSDRSTWLLWAAALVLVLAGLWVLAHPPTTTTTANPPTATTSPLPKPKPAPATQRLARDYPGSTPAPATVRIIAWNAITKSANLPKAHLFAARSSTIDRARTQVIIAWAPTPAQQPRTTLVLLTRTSNTWTVTTIM